MAGVVQEVELRNGIAKVTLAGLPQGKRTLTVRYAGSDAVNRAVVTRERPDRLIARASASGWYPQASSVFTAVPGSSFGPPCFGPSALATTDCIQVKSGSPEKNLSERRRRSTCTFFSF